MEAPEQNYEVAEKLSKPEHPHMGSELPESVRDKSDDPDSRLLESMRRKVDDSARYWDEIYARAKEDLNFAYYEQWDEAARQQREQRKRPVLSPNLIPQYINRITGAARQTKFSIHIQQTGGPSTNAVTSSGVEIPFSEVMEGMVRDIEAKSKAGFAYSRALQHATEGSIGWLKVELMTGPHDPFNAEILIKHLKNRFSVIVDHLAERPDLQDADFCFIGKHMHVDDFNKAWPEHALDKERKAFGWDVSISDNWYNTDSVMVGEFYWREPVTRVYIQMIHGETGEEYVLEKKASRPILDELEMLGFVKVKEKKHTTWEVKVMLCTAMDVLEKPMTWPGTTIPVVPVTGRQIDVEGGTDYQSLHRYARDPQIMFNYLCSSAIERVSNAPKAQWLATIKQIAGLDDIWNDAVVNARDMLYYKPNETDPPPQRIPGAEVPQAEIAMLQVMRSNLMESIGMYEASLGAKSNETSGRAIEQRQLAGDFGTMEFIDNLTNAIATVGDIICEILPKVYSRQKMRRLVMDDGGQVDIILNKVIVDEQTGTKHTINNIGIARFASHSIAGPSFTSQRSEAMYFLSEMAKANPQVLGIMPDLMVKFMDFAGSSAMARRLKHLVPRHMLSKEDQEALGPEQPTPEQQVEMMKAEAEGQKSGAQVQVAQLQVQQEQVQLETEMVKLEREKIDAVDRDMQSERENEKIEIEQQQAEEQQIDDESLDRKIAIAVKQALAEQNADAKIKQKV